MNLRTWSAPGPRAQHSCQDQDLRIQRTRRCEDSLSGRHGAIESPLASVRRLYLEPSRR